MCLNTTYKLLIGVGMQLLMAHVVEVDALPRKQKAMRKEQRGCRDALVIDKEEKRTLSVGCVDYRVVFNLIPHRLIKSLKSHELPQGQ